MGIILGALGGAGAALEQVGATNQKAQIAQDQATLESGLAQQRAETLEVFKNTLANQQRDLRTTAINTAQQGIVGSAVNAKYAGSDAAVAAAQGGASPEVSAAEGNDNVQAALTPEQQAVIAQSKARDTQAGMDSDQTYLKAAQQTGYLDPKDVMANDTKQQVAAIRAQAMNDVQNSKSQGYAEKIAYLTDRADKDRASREMLAVLRSIGNGKGDSETAKIKTANTYLETVNNERKAAGQDPMTFEEAYQIANYAPKPSQDDSIRSRVVLNLVANNPKLAESPGAFRSAVDNMMASIKDTDPPAVVTPPKPGASAPKDYSKLWKK